MTAPQYSSTRTGTSYRQQQQHAFYDDNILSEKLSYDDLDPSNGRQLEDDLEDLASIPVSKQLLRPSRSNLQNYILSSSRSNTPSMFEPQELQGIYYPPPPPEPQEQQRSRIPRSKSQSSLTKYASSEKKRSRGIDQDAREDNYDLTGDSSLQQAKRGGKASERSGAVGRGHPVGPNTNGRSTGYEHGGDTEEAAGDWEVLQAGGAAVRSGTGTTPRSASAPLLATGSSSNFNPRANVAPPSSQSSQRFPTSTPPGSAPMALSKSQGASRSRAQTNNLRTTVPSNSKSPPKPFANSPAQATPRRRAASTSASKALMSKNYEKSDEAPTDVGPLPPWSQSAPMVFRNENTGELATTGRIDQLVLPAVARKLEAARLAALGMNDQDLIHHWGPDGRPREFSTVPTRPQRPPQSQQPAPPQEEETIELHAPPPPALPSQPGPSPVRETFQQNQLRPKASFASLSIVAGNGSKPPSNHGHGDPYRNEASERPFAGVQPMDQQQAKADAEEEKRAEEKDADGGCCKCTIM